MRIGKKEHIRILKLAICTKKLQFKKRIKLILLRRSFCRRQGLLIGTLKLLKGCNKMLHIPMYRDYQLKWKDLFINLGISTILNPNYNLTKVNSLLNWVSGKYLSSRKSGSKYLSTYPNLKPFNRQNQARDMVYVQSYLVMGNLVNNDIRYSHSIVDVLYPIINHRLILSNINKILNLY